MSVACLWAVSLHVPNVNSRLTQTGSLVEGASGFRPNFITYNSLGQSLGVDKAPRCRLQFLLGVVFRLT